MSKIYLVLNALIAVSLVACAPGVKKQKTADAQTQTDKTDGKDNPDTVVSKTTEEGQIATRVKEVLSGLEIHRMTDGPRSIEYTIEPKEVEDAKKYKSREYIVHLRRSGVMGVDVEASTKITANHKKYYETLDGIFQGKLVVVSKPIDKNTLGAGTQSVKLVPAKNVKSPFIVEEPSVEKASETFFQDLSAQMLNIAEKHEKKIADKSETLVDASGKDQSACATLDLKGVWKNVSYSEEMKSETVLNLDAVSSTDATAKYKGKINKSDLSLMDDQAAPAVSNELAEFELDRKTCHLVAKHGDATSGFMLTGVIQKSGETAKAPATVVGFQMKACKDSDCKTGLSDLTLEYRLEVAK